MSACSTTVHGDLGEKLLEARVSVTCCCLYSSLSLLYVKDLSGQNLTEVKASAVFRLLTNSSLCLVALEVLY